MNSLVSIAGIDQAISNLLLSPETQKAKLLAAIRERFASDEELRTVTEIPADVLIAALWNDDPATLKDRRKSLSSLKSALNKSLKTLAEQGLNPEGLILSRANVFEVSDEQKKLLLEKAGIGGGDIHLAESIAACKQAFPGADGKESSAGLADFLRDLEQAKCRIDQLQAALLEREREISVLQERIGILRAGSPPGELAGDLDGGVTAGAGEKSGAWEGGDSAHGAELIEIVEEELEEIAIEDEAALAAGDGGGEGITAGGSEGDGAGVGGGAFSDSKIAADGSAEGGEVGGSSGAADEILAQDVEYVEIAE
ncbi:MAG: hypothetical protein PHI06_11210, partial [Desulfobulbaceae bacterium]|nr:hypothetical protein [Desulfobulbaceae bacterium]